MVYCGRRQRHRRKSDSAISVETRRGLRTTFEGKADLPRPRQAPPVSGITTARLLLFGRKANAQYSIP